MKVLILVSDDWEGLYIDGKLIDESETLGEGDNRLYLLKKAEEYKFTSEDVDVKEVYGEDIDNLYDCGNFPSNLADLKEKY